MFSPIDGNLMDIFHTHHAYSFESEDGTQILIHIGIDSAKRSKHIFKLKGKIGNVNKSSYIANVNLRELAKSTSSITPIIFPDMDVSKSINLTVNYGDKVKAGDLIMTIEK